MTSAPQRRARQAAAALCALALTLNGQAPAQTATTPVTSQAAPLPKGKEIAASNAYVLGAKAMERSDAAAAEEAFRRAAALDPNNRDYAQAVALAHERRLTDLIHKAAEARLHDHTTEADAFLAQARAIDPNSPVVAQHAIAPPRPPSVDIEQQPQRGTMIADAIVLQPDRARKTSFHIKGTAREVIRQVEEAYGIKVIFDDSTGSQAVRFDLDDVTYNQAMPVVFSMTQSFGTPLDEKTLLIAKETVENRARLDRQVQETIYIPGQTITQLQDLANVVRNLFDVKLLSVEQAQSSLVLRTTPDSLKAINLILADLLDGGSEVVLEMKIYEVDKTRSRDIGFQPPQFTAYNVASEAQKIVSNNQSLVNEGIADGLISANDSVLVQALALIASGLVSSSLLTNTLAFVGGTLDSAGNVSNQFTTTGIATTSAFTFNLALNSSETRPRSTTSRMRVGDRQTATLRSGLHYPVTTSTYVVPNASSLTAATNGTSAAATARRLHRIDQHHDHPADHLRGYWSDL